jgi:hypothetical protein
MAFLVVCAVPTLVVLGWAVWHHTPGHRQACARRIAHRLGVRASLANVSHPRPGATIFRGLELADIETGRTLLAVDELHAVGSRDTRLLSASRVQIAHSHFDPLWKILSARLRAWSCGSVRFAVNRVLLGEQTFAQVRGRLESTSAGAQTLVRFDLADAATTAPVWLRVVRDRQTSPPSTRIEVNTGDTWLACSTLGPVAPSLSQLGDTARFCGWLWAGKRSGGWEGELAGTLTGVDLERLVSVGYPHRLSGMAGIVVQRANFRCGRLEVATGSFVAGPGVIGRSLCQAAVDRLQLTTVDPMVGSRDPLPYEQIAFSYAVNADGLWLGGGCHAAPEGTILTTSTGPLLAAPRHQPLPVVALVRTLVPRHDLLVPATPEAGSLTQVLPLPTGTRARTAREQVPSQR